jgi:hypothetical protein
MTDSKELHEEALSGQDRLTSHIDDLAKSDAGDIEIPRKEWVSFLEGFSLQHEGWLVSVSVADGSKSSIEISNCRLRRITIDCTAKKCRVNISVLDSREQRVHSVPDPLHLIFNRDNAGAHRGLEIASADGSVTAVRFRAAVQPETLDGVLSTLKRSTLSGPLPEFCGRNANG